MISVIVITKDEERMIKPCLESVKWADEIIIYDNGSSDKTLEIARRYTDRVFTYTEQDFATLRNKAMEKASKNWVLYVDADERVLEPLKNEILEIIVSTDKSAFAISRRNIIFGQEVDYGPYKKDWVIRLFKKTEFKGWSGKVHESASFQGKLGYTKKAFLHLTHRNIDQIILKSLEWSYIDANLRLASGHPLMTGWRFLRIFISETINQLVNRKGLFGGTVGIMDSLLQSFSLYMTYVRLWQMQQPKDLNEVYKEIDQKLIESDFKNY